MINLDVFYFKNKYPLLFKENNEHIFHEANMFLNNIEDKKTLQIYSRVIFRFIFWINVYELQITPDILKDYKMFLENPQPYELFVGCKMPFNHPLWKPFNSKLSSREASFRDFGFAQVGNMSNFDIQPKDLNYPEARNNFNTKLTYDIPLFTGFKLSNQKDIVCHFVGTDFFANSLNNDNFYFHASFNDLETYLKTKQIENSTILIKGSRGMALERTLELL